MMGIVWSHQRSHEVVIGEKGLKLKLKFELVNLNGTWRAELRAIGVVRVAVMMAAEMEDLR